MPFKEYNELVEPLELPINGKVYRIPPVGFDEGIALSDGLDPESETKLPDELAFRLTLGPVLDEMRADHVTPAAIARAFMAALANWKRDRATAQVMWETGGDPKAIRAMFGAPVQDSTNEAAATTTPKAASTTGTTRSRKTSRKTPSGGSTSSTSGTSSSPRSTRNSG